MPQANNADSPDTTTIPVLPADATPDQKDEHWFKYVYQGDQMPQLTWRAVIMGGVLGMAMSAANLYTTLQIGWAFGIAITACVLSFVIWNFVRLTSGNKVSRMSILESACMASTASAAGYATGSTIATMFGALVLLHDAGDTPSDKVYTWEVTAPWVVVVFTLCTGLMGVFLAIPMKRQQINHEQLPYPTGTAAAETLKSLYSDSADAIRKAYALVAMLAAGLLLGFLRAPDAVLQEVGWLRSIFEKIYRIPGEIELHFADRLYPGGRHPAGFAFEPSALLIAAGMIVGMRVSLSLVLSSVLMYCVVGPKLADIDAQHMEKGAVVMMESVKGSAKATQTAEEAAASAVNAAVAAAATLEISEADVRATAEKAAAAALKFDAAKGENPPTAEVVANAVAGAVAPGAASAYSNRDATRAMTEARASALASGKAPGEADVLAQAAFDKAKYRPNLIWNWAGNGVVVHRWSLWGGTAVMVFASLASVALQWRTLARAFTGIGGGASNAARDAVEIPGRWMIYGMLPITIVMVWLQIQAFQVSWYAGIIAVAMSFVLSLVASRATGETDTTPIGAMGKVMQLIFAGLAPANVGANLASAGIAANSAGSSADLLQDLKTGYLLGANPRKQFVAQFVGVFFGTIAIVPIWYLMVPTREKLETFALPATRAWEAVARVLTKGVGELPPSAVYAIFIGAMVGTALPIIERLLPAKARRFMPSASGIGLAWVMPFQNAFSFLVGAVITEIWKLMAKRNAENYNVPVASGLIAGESLMQAGLAITATLAGIGKMKGWW